MKDGFQPGDRGDSAIYNYTARMYFTRQNGDKNLAVTFEFVTDVNTPVDKTPFEDAISSSLGFFIQYQSDKLAADPEAISRHVKVLVARDNDLLEEGTDFVVDWEKRTVNLLNPWYNYVYRIAIYVDMVKYNEVMEIHDSLKLRQNESVKRIAEVREDF